jgi:hypothetical protein
MLLLVFFFDEFDALTSFSEFYRLGVLAVVRHYQANATLFEVRL